MLGLQTAFFVSLLGLFGWSLLTQAQTAISLWPDYRWAVVGGIVACIYAVSDLAYRSREFLGWRSGGQRRRYYGWGRRYE